MNMSKNTKFFTVYIKNNCLFLSPFFSELIYNTFTQLAYFRTELS